MPEREDQHAERAEPQPPGDATHESTASAPALPPPARVSPSASAASSEGPPSNIHSVTPRSAEAHTDESTSSAEKASARAFWAAQHRFDALLEQYRQEHSSSPVDDPPVVPPSQDALVRSIPCSIERRYLLHQGWMHVTEAYLCFETARSGSSYFFTAATGVSPASLLSRSLKGNSAAASATEAPRTAPANAEAVETVAPEAGHSTIWLLPFEHITSVRKSSYWYVDNAVDVSATAVLCSSLNGPRTEPTRSAAGSADETAMVTVRFAAFSGVDRDAAYRILMKQWMARLSLMALEGRLPESIKASHRDKPDMSSAEAAAETSPSHRESRAAPDASSGSPVTTVTTETNHHETPNANSPEHPVAYDMDAGECELEIPLTGRDAASDLGSLAFQLLLADASSLPRQMHARMAHTDVCLPAWQALSTAKASEPKDKNATALTPATGWHRVISYQATVRRGPLTFTGHCIEVHRLYRSAADSNAECWRHEVLITTRELPACDAFRVHQQMQWQLRRDPNRRCVHLHVRAQLGIEWLARTVWRPLIERSVASYGRQAFELFRELAQQAVRERHARTPSDTDAALRRGRSQRLPPVAAVLVHALRHVADAFTEGVARLPPALVTLLLAWLVVWIAGIAFLCGYLWAQLRFVAQR
ncbi:hypothetical protein CDCA_CDCA03G1143 [Cyanidium caldarium]|uniref:VASt domain-containing protein n=1 Tax=Cyanidium caldarium TaxID=2771 RepID=A0AAV9ISQ9_CYACA|nr:hypothetical protein CDCA_CDCA03G1143 [Cyanidium caldarium]